MVNKESSVRCILNCLCEDEEFDKNIELVKVDVVKVILRGVGLFDIVLFFGIVVEDWKFFVKKLIC